MRDANEGKTPYAPRFSEEFKRDAARPELENGDIHRSATEVVVELKAEDGR